MEYRALSGGGAWSTRSTFSLSVNITDLTPGTLYEFNIVTRGPGGSTGETRLEHPLVFTTRTEGECVCYSTVEPGSPQRLVRQVQSDLLYLSAIVHVMN